MRIKLTLALALISGTVLSAEKASAMECTLSYMNPKQAWTAACGLKRGDGRWDGYIQGSLSGSKLSFSDGKNEKNIEGGALSPIATLEDIPNCTDVSMNSKSKDPEKTDVIAKCKALAKSVGLSLPFSLERYSQDPAAFSLSKGWNKKGNKAASGTELMVPLCENDKKPEEGKDLQDFQKKMECSWGEYNPVMAGHGGIDTGYSTPELFLEQTPLTMSDRAPDHERVVPDLYATAAVGCRAPTGGGVIRVCAGSIRCELREKRLFPVERNIAERAKQFEEGLKEAGLPSITDFIKAKGNLTSNLKDSRRSKLAGLKDDSKEGKVFSDGFQREFMPRLNLEKDGYAPTPDTDKKNGDALGGDIRRYIDPSKTHPKLEKLYDLMRIPRITQNLAAIPLAAGVSEYECLSSVMDKTASKEEQELVSKLDTGIKNGGRFGMNTKCIRMQEVLKSRKYIKDRMSLESLEYATKVGLWNDVLSISDLKKIDHEKAFGKTPSSGNSAHLSTFQKSPDYNTFLDHEVAGLMLQDSRFFQNETNETERRIQAKLMSDYRIRVGSELNRTEKPVVTDPIPVTCIPDAGKTCTPGNIDPIKCLADPRVGFGTQEQLRSKSIPVPTDPKIKMKQAIEELNANSAK